MDFNLSPELIALISLALTQALKWIAEKVAGMNLPFWLKPILSAVIGAIIKALDEKSAGVSVLTEGGVAGFAGSKLYDFGIAIKRKDATPLKTSV